MTIRYDDWDAKISPELLQEAIEHAAQVRAAMGGVLPEEVKQSSETTV